MSQHGESGRSKNERKEHDQKKQGYESTTSSNPYHLSKNMQIAMSAIAVILVVGVTFLFLTGIFHW